MKEAQGETVGLRKVVENSESMAAIGNILAALEGMQDQVMALTDLVAAQDKTINRLTKRIEKLEFGPAPVMDMRGRVKGRQQS